MEGKINYHLLCEKTLEEIKKNNLKPRLLLHSCCGPCSSYVLEFLSLYFDITVLYYNPNIDTGDEYNHRAIEQKKLIENMGLNIKLIVLDYEPYVYYNSVKGYEDLKEGGKRCSICFNLRLEKTAQLAKELKFDYFTTSLSISPMKNSKVLNEIGNNLANKYGVPYLFSDFKKKGGYLRSIELSKKYNMYRQDYCGCIFSKKERENRLKLKGNTSQE